ncbi:MAG TPA: alpha/beta hydrolase [Stellaceae bacterium]
MADTPTAPRADFTIEDLPFGTAANGPLLMRLYRPRGSGPFPAVIDIHGGAWTGGDRTQNGAIAAALANAGILVASLDFRMPPEARYPETLADINLGIRWLKSRAAAFHVRADWIGGFGTSSGGHQILLSAMRPADPRYAALPLPGAPHIDARLAFVISGWGVLDPLLRYRLATERGAQSFVASHDAFWGSEAAMSEGSPPLMLARGEPVELPPALIFQGTDDEWVPQAMTQRFVAAYREAGGEIELELLPGARHSFFRDDSSGPNARKAIALVRDYILKRTVGA